MENQDVFKKAKSIIRAIYHKERQKVIDVVKENPGITVTEIYVKLRVEQSVASQHLSILRNAGVVYAERDSKKKKYFFNQERYDSIVDILNQL